MCYNSSFSFTKHASFLGLPRSGRKTLNIVASFKVEPEVAFEVCSTPYPEGGQDHGAVGGGGDVLAEGLLARGGFGLPLSAGVAATTVES
jgi:hypothetical protein